MRQHDEQVTGNHPEVVRSEPVPVKSPGGEGGPGHRDGGRAEPLPEDRPEFHQPAPLPTAFGATTVGGAVAASAMASGRPADERDPRGEDTARPGDGAIDRRDRVGAEADPLAGHPLPDLGPNPTGTPDPDATSRYDLGSSDPDATARYDLASSDPDATARHDMGTHDPDATARYDMATHDRDRSAAPVDDAPGYGSAEPTMVDPDTAPPVSPAATADQKGTAATTGAATGRPPGTHHVSDTTLFTSETSGEYRDRWREVQLRFVDDPRAAAGEAQQVVEDAIEAVARSLATRKDELGGWQRSGSDDTEELRVVVRRYRDFLDRLLGL